MSCTASPAGAAAAAASATRICATFARVRLSSAAPALIRPSCSARARISSGGGRAPTDYAEAGAVSDAVSGSAAAIAAAGSTAESELMFITPGADSSAQLRAGDAWRRNSTLSLSG